ncbi:MAG: ABC transporter ATP-binding protein [Spirochaetota bacterium]|jgi:lipooligosaccharide transport system ATP-binding protein|nr:ABC transporter ATP-binding protein [Spirochaetota bacterium]
MRIDTKNPVITARGVTKNYGALRAVDGLSFQVRAGTCFGLLGPNGAGKSTMMKMLYGKAERTAAPDEELLVFGYDPARDALAIKALSGMAQQEDSLDSELDVLTNMLLYARFYGIPKKEALRRTHDLLEFMELDGKQRARIRELSGGMKRRLVIARALLNEPKLLILDEPTNGLDPQVRHLIWDRLHSLRAGGTTVLISTHYMDEAYHLCDELVIMDQGRAVLQGNPRELVEKNIERYALQIFTRASLAPARRKNAQIRIEEAGGMLYIYADTLPPLEKLAAALTSRDYILRQTNLEDLFLRATGKGLNDEQ